MNPAPAHTAKHRAPGGCTETLEPSPPASSAPSPDRDCANLPLAGTAKYGVPGGGAKRLFEPSPPAHTRTHIATPTPANTGAPMPGYRQRTNITPQSTGAPMPKANTPQTPPVPVKPKGKKPTAPGTKPKKN